MLCVEGIEAGYGEAQVLFGVDLEVAGGEVVALLGRNGMGKTTIVRGIFGLLPRRKGRISFEGCDLTNAPPFVRAQHGLGLVPEGRQAFPTLTVEENLVATAAARFGSPKWTLPKIYALFPRLAERRSHFGDQLSGGEQQMLAIGRALMTNPKLLVFDEATEGLAPLIRAEIRACLAGLKASGEFDPRHRQEHRRAAAHRRSTRGAGKGTRRMARHERGIQGESGGRGSPSPCRRRRTGATAAGKDDDMILTPGITKAGEGLDNIAWNILGQTYVPKQVSERSFAWHATFPPDTFVPPHIHPTQDEFIYMFEGQFELMLDGRGAQANPGDLVRLPMGLPHGIFNKSGRIVKCLFWVTPTRRLYDLFWGIHNMAEQTPAEVVALSAKHEVDFLPPPEEAK